MAPIDLKTDKGLRAAGTEVRSRIDPVREVAALLREIRDASEARRATLNFQDFTALAIPAKTIPLAHTIGSSANRRSLRR